MNEYEEEIRCPFCEEADGCKHLVAAFDHENANICGGLFFDHENEIHAWVAQELDALFASQGESVDWSTRSDFEELWSDFVARKESSDERPLDSGALAHLLDSLLQGTDAIYKADGPVTAFFDRNPQRVYEQVVKKLRNAFKSMT